MGKTPFLPILSKYGQNSSNKTLENKISEFDLSFKKLFEELQPIIDVFVQFQQQIFHNKKIYKKIMRKLSKLQRKKTKTNEQCVKAFKNAKSNTFTT